MKGQVISAAELGSTRLSEEFDYVIVGSGAAGATAGRMLVDTGASVAIAEEGAAVPSSEFGATIWPTGLRLYREMATLTSRGNTPVTVLQGSCLGGSTVVNSAIVRYLPESVWSSWDQEHHLGDAIPYGALEQHWQTLERELSAEPTPPELWGGNNRLMAKAAGALGVRGGPTTRYMRECRGSARCQLGCPYGAKQSMLVSYLPYAVDRGALVLTGAKVERALVKSGRAVGVEGRYGTPKGAENFTLRARKGVLVAASAIQTPVLLSRTGVRSPHLGRHYQVHPGLAMVGVFDEEVGTWAGATQGYAVDQHLEDYRCKIETLALPPELVLAQLPGAGRRWLDYIGKARHMAVWAVLLRAHAQGTVRERRFPKGTSIRFDLEPRDIVNLRKGLRSAAELFFAAGAREVLPGIHGLPESLTSPEQAALLEEGPSNPASYTLSTSHLFGTARMSVRPEDGVVGTGFAVHGVPGLYVVDSSVFPTNLGVNPQHTIMAVAMHAAQRISETKP